MREGRPPGAAAVEPALPRPHGRFAPEAAFGQVRPRREAVRATTAGEIDDELFGERFDAVYAPVAEQPTLVTPGGLWASDVPLHIDGAGTWFRWSG
nr:hypothetical protein OG409_29985 [Streptomyces sp. NBC_00974]